MKKLLSFSLLIASLAVFADNHEEEAIGAVIDNFHAAAAAGDKDRYLGI